MKNLPSSIVFFSLYGAHVWIRHTLNTKGVLGEVHFSEAMLDSIWHEASGSRKDTMRVQKTPEAHFCTLIVYRQAPLARASGCGKKQTLTSQV